MLQELTVTVLTPPQAWCGSNDNHADLMAIEDPLSDIVVAYWCILIFEALVVGGSAGAVLMLLMNKVRVLYSPCWLGQGGWLQATSIMSDC